MALKHSAAASHPALWSSCLPDKKNASQLTVVCSHCYRAVNFAPWSSTDPNEASHFNSMSISCPIPNTHTHTHLQPIGLSLPLLWNSSVPPLSYFSIYSRRAPAVSKMPAVSFCFRFLTVWRIWEDGGGLVGWEVFQFKSLRFLGPPGVIFIHIHSHGGCRDGAERPSVRIGRVCQCIWFDAKQMFKLL